MIPCLATHPMWLYLTFDSCSSMGPRLSWYWKHKQPLSTLTAPSYRIFAINLWNAELWERNSMMISARWNQRSLPSFIISNNGRGEGETSFWWKNTGCGQGSRDLQPSGQELRASFMHSAIISGLTDNHKRSYNRSMCSKPGIHDIKNLAGVHHIQAAEAATLLYTFLHEKLFHSAKQLFAYAEHSGSYPTLPHMSSMPCFPIATVP